MHITQCFTPPIMFSWLGLNAPLAKNSTVCCIAVVYTWEYLGRGKNRIWLCIVLYWFCFYHVSFVKFETYRPPSFSFGLISLSDMEVTSNLTKEHSERQLLSHDFIRTISTMARRKQSLANASHKGLVLGSSSIQNIRAFVNTSQKQI